MRSAALVQLVNSALETLRRKEMAPLWHRLDKNSHIEKPAPCPNCDGAPGKKALAAAQHAIAAAEKTSSVYVVLSFESSCGRAWLWGNLPVRRRRRLGQFHLMRREVRPLRLRRVRMLRIRLGRAARAQ